MKKLYTKWEEENRDGDSYVKNSFDEILYAIFRTVAYNKYPKHFDEMIDKIGDIIKDEFNIKDDNLINWQTIEEWYCEWCSNLTNHLDTKEIETIFKTLKINSEEWEEPTAKIDIEDIGNRLFNSIEETLKDRFNWDKDIKKEFLENANSGHTKK